jgi:hypothetical protein
MKTDRFLIVLLARDYARHSKYSVERAVSSAIEFRDKVDAVLKEMDEKETEVIPVVRPVSVGRPPKFKDIG